MLEEALSDMVKQQLTETLQRMQIAPLMKPHEVATALQVIDTLDIMQTLGLIAHVDLSEAVLIIKLNHEALVNHLGINPDDLDHDYLSFEQPVTFQRRSNGTKMVWATYKSEPNHALIRAIVQSRSWVEKLKAGYSVYGHHSIRRHFRRQVVEAYSPGLPITQACHRYFGWHHRSGADHKEAIGQGYPPQLGGPACKVPLLNSLLIRIKFPVNFSTHAQNPNTPCRLARAPIQKQKYSLLISLLIPKNRENPPSPNELLSKG